MEHFGLYIIVTKPVLPYTTIAEQCVASGVRMLQLREKHLPDGQLLKIAKTLRSITEGTNTRLVINDRPDIAVLCRADYLHLGQDDMPIDEARRLVGDMKIGLSTHSLAQAREALIKKPDYIGFGPIYPTNAKAIPDPPVGTSLLKQVLELADTVPVVAIGGIFPENLHEVMDTGARNVALVRHFMQSVNLNLDIYNINHILNKK